MKLRIKKAFTLVEIMAASLIMTAIVLSVLVITSNILNTWSRASGQLQSYFDAMVIGSIIQEDFESIKVRKDGRAWLEVSYPEVVGYLMGEDYTDATPLRPPEIMFYSPTLLRPRYTRENMASATGDAISAIQIPGSACAIKYQISLKSPFMQSSSNPADNASQANAFYGFYRAVIDPKSTALEAMGSTVQGYTATTDGEEFRHALQQNLWNGTCTVISEEGVEQPGADLKSWVLSPENLLVNSIVDFRVTFAILYPNPEATAGSQEPEYKIGYIPAGTPFTVGPRILTDAAYEYSNGSTVPLDPRLLEDGFLAFADFSMTLISDAGAKEMRALQKSGTLTQDSFKRLVLAHGNTVVRRVQFISEPSE